MPTNIETSEQPLVEVLLSTYRPNPDYLKAQLESIGKQDYPNLRLLVHNDCPGESIDTDLFKNACPTVPIKYLPETGKNYGYTKAFERLVEHSTGEYIAFCDQDDIWLPNKITKMTEAMQADHSLAAASERTIIDGNGTVIKTRARTGSTKGWDNWATGDNIFVHTSVICYAVGMSMLLNGDFARSVIPFSSNTGHDKWALICASAEGTVSFVDEPLVMYRRHGENVSGTLVGINSKEDYRRQRVEPFLNLCNEIVDRYPDHPDINLLKSFAVARDQGNALALLKYRNVCPQVALFDAVVALTPNVLFKSLVNIARKM